MLNSSSIVTTSSSSFGIHFVNQTMRKALMERCHSAQVSEVICREMDEDYDELLIARQRSYQFMEVMNCFWGFASDAIYALIDAFEAIHAMSHGYNCMTRINRLIRTVLNRPILVEFNSRQVNELLSYMGAIAQTKRIEEDREASEDERRAWEQACNDAYYEDMLELEMLPYLTKKPPSSPRLNVGNWIEEYYA